MNKNLNFAPFYPYRPLSPPCGGKPLTADMWRGGFGPCRRVGLVHSGSLGVITGQLQLTGHSNRTLSILLLSLLLFWPRFMWKGGFI